MNLRDLIILFTLLCLSLAVFAASESEEKHQTVEQTKSTTSKPVSSKSASGKRVRVKTLEEFIPSEEVSADKPVAFPSDI